MGSELSTELIENGVDIPFTAEPKEEVSLPAEGEVMGLDTADEDLASAPQSLSPGSGAPAPVPGPLQ